MIDYNEMEALCQYLIEEVEYKNKLAKFTRSVDIGGDNTVGHNLMLDMVKDSAIKVAASEFKANNVGFYTTQEDTCGDDYVLTVFPNESKEAVQRVLNILNMKYGTRHMKFSADYSGSRPIISVKFITTAPTINFMNEADNAASTQKTSSNIADIIKTIVTKFVNYSNNKINSNKEYLSTMKDKIIAKVQGENVPIEMRDYTKGTANIKNFKLVPFESIQSKITTPGDKTACEAQMKSILLPAYTDQNVDFRQFCKSYFMGGDTINKTNINSLNMQDIYDYCANFNAIENDIVVNMNSLTRLASTANQNAQAIKQNDAKLQQEKNDAAQAKQQAQQQKQTQQQESARTHAIRNRNIIASIFNEDAPAPAPQPTPQPTNGAQAAPAYKMSMDKSANATNPQTPPSANTNTPANNQPDQTKTLNNTAVMINAYRTIAMAIISGEMFAANTIYNDYVTIMKTHAPEASANSAPAAPQMVLDNPSDTLNKIAQIQKETDKNQQTKDITDLIAQVKQKNPSFAGGLNDIASAANKLVAQQKQQQQPNTKPNPNQS